MLRVSVPGETTGWAPSEHERGRATVKPIVRIKRGPSTSYRFPRRMARRADAPGRRRNPTSRAGQGESVLPEPGPGSGSRPRPDGVVRRLRDGGRTRAREAAVGGIHRLGALEDIARRGAARGRAGRPRRSRGRHRGGGPNRLVLGPRIDRRVPGTGGADPARVDRREPDSVREEDSRVRDGDRTAAGEDARLARRAARYSFISSARRAGSRSE